MSMKRKRKNGEQTFISWQVEAWRRLIDVAIEGFKGDWDEANRGDKTYLVGCIIPMLLIVAWAFCGLAPSMLFGISNWYSTIACSGIYIAVLVWVAKCWLNGRYDEYIDDVENNDRDGNEDDRRNSN